MTECKLCERLRFCNEMPNEKYSREFYAAVLKLYLEGKVSREELGDWNNCIEKPSETDDELLYYSWIALHDLKNGDPDYMLTFQELVNLYNCLSGKKEYSGFLSLV